MEIDEIVDYATNSPENTNPAVLRSMLSQLNEEGKGATMEETTYAELVAKRNAGELIPGQQYRITDYVCTTTQEETRVVSHPYDIIVIADNENTLNENARACLHEGDNYYSAEGNLAKWELKYYLDNDSIRFGWIDPDNGKGVVYYLKDECNNECTYDFKQIQFKRYMITKFTAIPSLVGEYTCRNPSYPSYQVRIDTDNPLWCYTFSSYDPEFEPQPGDASIGRFSVFNNIITGYSSNLLPNNVFFCSSSTNQSFNVIQGANNTFGKSCNNNTGTFYLSTFGHSCSYNTFGDGCMNNAFGTDCSYNTFGRDCRTNSFESYCQFNTLGSNCASNTFGDHCIYNSLGRECDTNTFGNGCAENILGADNKNNTFKDGCADNTFENGCYGNTFEDGCSNNVFMANSFNNTFGMGCNNNTFEDGCHGNTFGNGCVLNVLKANNYNNTFGHGCFGNNFGIQCTNITFGNGCVINTLGISCNYISTIRDSKINNITLSPDCAYIDFVNEPADQSAAQNFPYHILGKVQGTQASHISIDVSHGTNANEVITYVGKNSSGVLKTWVPADLVSNSQTSN